MNVRARLAALLCSTVLVASLVPAAQAAADDGPAPSAPPVAESLAPAGSIAEPALAFPAIPDPTVSISAASPPKLTASFAAGDLPAGVSVTWAWLRGAVVIAGATSSGYTVSEADRGQSLTARATISKSGYTTVTKVSGPQTDFAFTASGPLSVSGGAHVGDAYTITPPTYSKAVTLAYAWKRNGVLIAGEAQATYQAKAADLGRAITAQVTATAPGNLPLRLEALLDAPARAQFAITGAPVISGPVSKVLTATLAASAITDPHPELGPYVLLYQWSRNGAPIAGATHQTYALTTADIGTTTSVTVTVRKAGYDDATASAGGAFTMAYLTAPTFTGTPKLNSTLGVIPPAYYVNGMRVDPELTFRWMRDGVTITSADAMDNDGEYTLAGADQGHAISVRLTAHEAGGDFPDVVWTSPATQGIGVFVFTPDGVPTVAAAGSPATLTVTSDGVAETGVTVKYQWLRNGTAIAGATAATYKLTQADVGTLTSVRLAVSKTSYTRYLGSSVPTSYTLAASSAPGLFVSGTPKVGDELIAVVPSYTTPTGGTPTPNFVFQWLRNGVVISGESGAKYIVRSGDKGARISLRMIASWPGLNQAIGTSSQTLPVASGLMVIAPNQPLITPGPTGLVASLPAGTVTTPQVTLAYQWLRNGAKITGATKSVYRPGAADKGKTLTVRVVVSKANVTPTSVTLPVSEPFNPNIRVSDPGTGDLIPIYGNGTVGGLVYVGPGWSWVYADAGAAAASVSSTAYQWYRQTGPAGTPVAIAGATSATYTQVAADWGTYLRVRLVVTGPSIVPYVVYSGAAGPIGSGVNSNDGTAVATMNPATDTLTASLTSLAPATPKPVLSYQWYRTRNGTTTTIAGATATTYKIQFADYDATVWVRITVKRDKFVPGDAQYSVDSTPTSYTLTPSADPPFGASPQYGTPLAAPHPVFTTPAGGAPATTPRYTYVWLRNSVNSSFGAHIISGATGATYTPTTADLYQYLMVSISVKYPGYLATGVSSAVSNRVNALNLGWNGSYPVLVRPGTGTTFTAPNIAGLFSTAPTSYTYRWLRGGAGAPFQIAGATSSSYTLTAEDYGHQLSVQITAHRTGYDVQDLISNPLDVSIGADYVEIAGQARTDQVLTAVVHNPSAGGLSFANQWWRSDVGGAHPVKITGATSYAYKLTAADVGKQVWVNVTLGKAGYIGRPAEPVTPVEVQAASISGSPAATLTYNFSTQTLVATRDLAGISTAGTSCANTWYRDGTLLAGVVGLAYKPTAAARSAHWVFRVTCTKAGYTPNSVEASYTYT